MTGSESGVDGRRPIHFVASTLLMPGNTFCICVASLTLGYYAPNVYISNVAAKRRASIMQGFGRFVQAWNFC